MKINTGRALLVASFLMAASTITLPAFGQAGFSRQLTLKHPDEAEFEVLLDANFPGFSSMENYRAFRAFLVLLRNDTSIPANAYSIEWEVRSEDMVNRLENHRVQKPFGTVAERRRLVPREIRLVSPIFNVNSAEYRLRRDKIASLMVTFGSHPPYSSANIRSITATVDAAIYEDGAYGGPDRSHLLMRYECLRQAERNQAEQVLQLLQTNAAPQVVLAQLEQEVRTAVTVNTARGDRNSVCSLYRGEEAQKLIALHRRAGLASLRKRVSALAARSPEVLSPLTRQ